MGTQTARRAGPLRPVAVLLALIMLALTLATTLSVELRDERADTSSMTSRMEANQDRDDDSPAPVLVAVVSHATARQVRVDAVKRAAPGGTTAEPATPSAGRVDRRAWRRGDTALALLQVFRC